MKFGIFLVFYNTSFGILSDAMAFRRFNGVISLLWRICGFKHAVTRSESRTRAVSF